MTSCWRNSQLALPAWRHAHHHQPLVDLAGCAQPDDDELGDDLLVTVQDRLDHAQPRVGVVDRGAERCAQVDQEAPLVLVGREGLADLAEEPGAAAYRGQGDRHDQPAMAERQRQQPAVAAIHAGEEAVEDVVDRAVLPGHLQVARAQHRRQGERDEQRDQHAGGDYHGERAEELADDAREEDHRREDRHQRERGRHHREHHLAAAVDRRGYRVRVELFAMAVDVFEHHDRVVDHHADQQQQGEHGERVQRVAGKIDHGDRAHQRDRDGQRDYQRRAERA